MDGDEPFPEHAVQTVVDAMACAVGILTLIRCEDANSGGGEYIFEIGNKN